MFFKKKTAIKNKPIELAEFNGTLGPFKSYLRMATIAKDEGPYLKEWVEFHRICGVERFIIYDNGSTDGTEEILAPYIKNGLVTYIPWPTFLKGENHQFLAYAHAISLCRENTFWLAMVDADEFLFPIDKDDLRDFLSGMEEFPAMAAYSKFFGTSGHDAAPDGLVIENYLQCVREHPTMDREFKAIVQPRHIKEVRSARKHVSSRPGVVAFDENRQPIYFKKERESNPSRKQIGLNHYFTRSLSEWQAKINRGQVNMPIKGEKLSEYERNFNAVHEDSVEDKTILKHLPKLKEAMST